MKLKGGGRGTPRDSPQVGPGWEQESSQVPSTTLRLRTKWSFPYGLGLDKP